MHTATAQAPSLGPYAQAWTPEQLPELIKDLPEAAIMNLLAAMHQGDINTINAIVQSGLRIDGLSCVLVVFGKDKG